jgi:hypothetical protein
VEIELFDLAVAAASGEGICIGGIGGVVVRLGNFGG